MEHILTELSKPLFLAPEKLQVIMGVLNKKSDNPINVDLSALLQPGGDRSNGAAMARARPINSSSVTQIAVVGATGSLPYRTGEAEDVGSGIAQLSQYAAGYAAGYAVLPE